MKDKTIRKLWEDFIIDYKDYFLSNTESWNSMLNSVKQYIDKYKKRPSKYDKHKEIKQMYQWIDNQQTNYKKNINIMKDITIKKQYEQFITEYQEYFPDNSAIQNIPAKKSTTIKPKSEKEKESDNNKQKRQLSEYQELSKKMTTQKSEMTNKMFDKQPQLWELYHKARDASFKGYNKQGEIPINKIIMYLETKNKKLKILDLGCGRNLIKKHFEKNKKFDITGYDYVSHNNSIACDISNLPDDDETVDVCIFSQSLMGHNWKSYITEAFRVLKYNSELIISESIERFDTIKKYIDDMKYIIKACHNEKSNRWFYLYIINDTKI
jgi:hypothetical protein